MAAEFTDRLGRTWPLVILVRDLKPLRDQGFDAGSLKGVIDWLETDAGLDALPEVCWRLTSNHAPPGCTRDEFEAGFDGPTWQAAGGAIVEAVGAFTRQSPAAAAMVASLNRLMTLRATRAGEMVEATLNASAGNSAGSSASTPAPSA